MRALWQRLLQVRHHNQMLVQRGRNTILVALALIGLNLALVLLALMRGVASFSFLVPPVVGTLILIGAIALTRIGQVELVSLGLIVIGFVGSMITIVTEADRYAPLFLLIVQIVALALLSTIEITALGVAVVLALPIVSMLLPAESPLRPLLIVTGVVSVITTIVSIMVSAGNGALRRQLESMLAQSQQAAQQLQALNAELDQRVAAQTAALREAVSALEARTAEQDRLLAEVIAQRDVIRQLSAPVLPVSQTALVLPLIGTIDQERLVLAQQHALNAIEQQRARRLILDVTGVPVIDTHAAAGLIQLAQSARLLGAEVTLVGVRPEVAQTMVSLGVELPMMRVYSDLAAALNER